MFSRAGEDVLTFRVYDGYGNCISEFTGTMREWQNEVAARLPARRHLKRDEAKAPERPRLLN